MLEALESRLLLSRPGLSRPMETTPIPAPSRSRSRRFNMPPPWRSRATRSICAGMYRETVTPARSGTASAPITYSAYADESVTLDGADPITGWTYDLNSKTIFSATQAWDMGMGNNQVFVDGQAVNEASWPNTAVGAVQPATAAVSSVYSSAIGTGYYYADTATLSVPTLPGGPGAWDGATIHIGMGQGWTVQTGTVLNSGNGTLTYAYRHQTNYETPVAGNKFYLTGKFVGLDSAGEWYRDPTTSKLHLWTPAGDNPTKHTVEAKHRLYAFELSGLSYINLRNIHIFASSIDTSAASSHVSISNLSASYVSQQMLNPIGWINNGATTGLLIRGSYDVVQNSTITYSSGNGIFLGGSNNIVQNCTIAYTDYSGVDEAGITVIGANQQILSNVIHDTGRDGILDSNATNARINYNTIYNIGHQTTDLGAIYDYGTDSHGTIIAYNVLSNIHTGGYGAAGVYLDNGSADFTVHDNKISSADIPIKLNPPSYSNKVFNNTINGKVVAGGSSAGGSPAAGPGTTVGKSSTLSTLGTLGGFKSNGAGINNSGQVVGSAMASAAQLAFQFSNNAMTGIDAFGTGQGEADAINASGQVVGSAYLPSGYNVAFLESGGKVQSLGTLAGDTNSSAAAINSSGQIVGLSYGTDAIGKAFLYSNGVMKPLGTLGGAVSEAFGINDAGTVVGSSTIAGDRDAHAFSYTAGTIHDLGTLGGSSSYALAINGSGQIAGASLIAGNSAFHAFLYTGGTLRDLGSIPGFRNSIATSINTSGEVVGYAYNTDISASHAFIYRNGVMTDLNTLLPANVTWRLTNATGINDHDQITGTVSDSQLRSAAYILALFA